MWTCFSSSCVTTFLLPLLLVSLCTKDNENGARSRFFVKAARYGGGVTTRRTSSSISSSSSSNTFVKHPHHQKQPFLLSSLSSSPLSPSSVAVVVSSFPRGGSDGSSRSSSSSSTNAEEEKEQGMVRSILEETLFLPSILVDPLERVLQQIMTFVQMVLFYFETLTGIPILPHDHPYKQKLKQAQQPQQKQEEVEEEEEGAETKEKETTATTTKKKRKKKKKKTDDGIASNSSSSSSSSKKKKKKEEEPAPEKKATTTPPKKGVEKATTTTTRTTTITTKKKMTLKATTKPKAKPKPKAKYKNKNKLSTTDPNYRIQRELKEFMRDPPHNVAVQVGKNLRIWIVTLHGVDGTIYAGELFRLRISFPSGYPIVPPSVYFIPKPAIPLHEHVYTNGDICLSLLGKGWKPTMTAQSIAVSILSILSSAQAKALPMDNARHAQNKPGQYQQDWVYHDDNC